MKLKELAERLECRLEGDPLAVIHGVAGIEQAEPGEVTFLANRRYAPNLKTTRASAVFIEDGVEVEREAGGGGAVEIVQRIAWNYSESLFKTSRMILFLPAC